MVIGRMSDSMRVQFVHDALDDIGAAGTFRLRSFPDRVFRVNRSASYVSDGVVQLIVQVQLGNLWEDFSRTHIGELLRVIVPPCETCQSRCAG